MPGRSGWFLPCWMGRTRNFTDYGLTLKKVVCRCTGNEEWILDVNVYINKQTNKKMVFNKNIKKEVNIHSLQQAVKRNACICHFWTLRKMLIPQRCIKHLLKTNTTLQHKTNQTGGIPCYCHLSTFKALGIVVAVVRVFLCLVVTEMQDMDLLECYCAKFTY